jgi:hypothetical protein
VSKSRSALHSNPPTLLSCTESNNHRATVLRSEQRLLLFSNLLRTRTSAKEHHLNIKFNKSCFTNNVPSNLAVAFLKSSAWPKTTFSANCWLWVLTKTDANVLTESPTNRNIPIFEPRTNLSVGLLKTKNRPAKSSA